MKYAKARQQAISSLFHVRDLFTVIALVVSLFVTYRIWMNAERTAAETIQTTFGFHVQEISERIEQRASTYEQVLRATVGMFGAADEVSREGFRTFVRKLRLEENYPGIQGIGFALAVPHNKKEDHIAAVRKEGFPNYTIWPDGERAFYAPIIYLEPFSGKNLRAFGYDMYSESTRRAAMEQARDTDETGVSNKVTLVQEEKTNIQPGFLMYLPVYRNGLPYETLEQRQTNLIGWVYAPFRMDDFMQAIGLKHHENLGIEIYTSTTPSASSRIFDSAAPIRSMQQRQLLTSTKHIRVGNRVWTLFFTAPPEFVQSSKSDRPLLVLRAGISISLMFALLTWLFLDDRARALQIADQAMQLALYDALTGLPNRKLLEERLLHALAQVRRKGGHLALLFIDLDKFKPVNDNYGHAYGDLLLKEVAKRLQNCMRESDTASRLGGDEFVALLSDIETTESVLLVANKILNLLTEAYEINGHSFAISASIGVAIYPWHGTNSKALMKQADLAMYDAKNSGRSTVKLARSGTPEAAA